MNVRAISAWKAASLTRDHNVNHTATASANSDCHFTAAVCTQRSRDCRCGAALGSFGDPA